MVRSLRIGLLGLGNVARGVLQILRNEQDLLIRRAGVRLEVVRVCDRSYQKKADIIKDIPTGDDPADIFNDDSIDVVLELAGGLEPARTWILTALQRGQAVVTANKAVLARHGNEIFQAAREHGCDIGFEAAVAASLPIIKNLRRGLIANHINTIYGILNGTCNFILTRMEGEGMDYGEALRLAQERGFAESDPTFDVEGHDAAQKLAIISALAFDTAINEEAVLTRGITALRAVDLELARRMHCVVRLLAIARRDPLQMRVQPTMIPQSHMLASVRDEKNAVMMETSNAGPQMIMGLGAGSLPTASAVVSDLVYLANKSADSPEYWLSGDSMPQRFEDHVCKYYLRFQARDRPGVLAEIARILSNYQISIASVHQEEGPEPVDVMVITHSAPEKKLLSALKEVDDHDFIAAPTVAVPMEFAFQE
ncbi:MAG: homoserine dehydrogenase [Leptospiraceae bacterium]|nr:homoserine dehydrogenase [Leptospiraceae bacterium]MCB1314574.1 homoserine dehydrogenase [Leptospiraceae bacterium]MCB1322830.1 homoserine dehydrogenase [Leptospiraceae bacterium]